jgi:hypothetical protein
MFVSEPVASLVSILKSQCKPPTKNTGEKGVVVPIYDWCECNDFKFPKKRF